MKRRDFIFQSCAACLATGLIGGLASSCSGSKYIAGEIGTDGITISKNDFKVIKKGDVSYLSFLVIRNDALKYPLYVYRFTELEYVALWMQCTHQGTELQAFGDSLQCPAHGSEFDNRGNVTSGPADRQLRNFVVTATNDDLFIDLRRKA